MDLGEFSDLKDLLEDRFWNCPLTWVVSFLHRLLDLHPVANALQIYLV